MLKTDQADFYGFALIWAKCIQNELFRLLLKIAQSSFVDIWRVVTSHEALRNGLYTKTC